MKRKRNSNEKKKWEKSFDDCREVTWNMTVWDFGSIDLKRLFNFHYAKNFDARQLQGKVNKTKIRNKREPVTGSVGLKLITATQNSLLSIKVIDPLTMRSNHTSMYMFTKQNKTKISNWFVSVTTLSSEHVYVVFFFFRYLNCHRIWICNIVYALLSFIV